ncbi:pentapeptide repeat-containing protein [Streptomyces sp. NPDC057429]|uniref:pentapeptide repeat-containing protein n=1 Tax=Streptomyces sp. NPDC057429 TaxID=3346130 RepID=UPI003686FD53
MSHPSPSLTPPAWPHCGNGSTPDDPIGCRGIHVPGHTACLAHLAAPHRDAYLAGLAPGADIDHRGTLLTWPLLDALRVALRDPTTRGPHLGSANFECATFTGGAGFGSATFTGDASFVSAVFTDGASFHSATFERDSNFLDATFEDEARFDGAKFKGEGHTASFDGATFKGETRFDGAKFKATAWFDSTFEREVSFRGTIFEGASFNRATFAGDAWFDAATFAKEAEFKSATFTSQASFESTTFVGNALFDSATFERTASLGPFTCDGLVQLSRVVFGGPVTVSLAARRVECQRTRWAAMAELHLRYATVDFARAVFEYPLTIAAEANPFVLTNKKSMAEPGLTGSPDARVRIASLHGVDAAHLVLADVDLSQCLFAGTVHLDQLRLEGACAFDKVPSGTVWRGWLPVRFTERRALAEEHHWRASQAAPVPGWKVGTGGVGPAQLAPVYRALRKSFEDSKDEPGAADFYYGEMEMRRHDPKSSRSERGLLHGYWLLSGYGLRASRALGWLVAAVLVTIVLLMGFGLPKDDPKQEATGKVPSGGGTVTFEIDKADPQNPTGDRFSGKRFEKALNVTLNSVVFRSSGQDLTTAGTYIEMTSRVLEPILLGLAVLAVRNRVKR